MDSDVQSTAESGYCLKRETQQTQTQTEISTSEEAIQTDPPRTREISVQTCDIPNTNGCYPVWIKCGVGLIGMIVCVLVLYGMNGYISCSKNESVGSSGQCVKCQCHHINRENPQDNTDDVTYLHISNEIAHMKENNKNLTVKLQNLTIEQQQLKTHLEERRIAQNQSETRLNKCKVDLENTNTTLNSKVKQCEIKNKDLEDKILKYKTIDKYKGDGDTILNLTSCKSENDSSNAILKKKIQEFEASEYDLKQKLTRSEELKHRVVTKLNFFKQKVTKKDKDINEFGERLGRSAREIKELKSSALKLKAENKNLTEVVKMLKKHNDFAKLSEHELNQTIIETESINNKLRNKNRDLQNSNEDLKKKTKILETTGQKLNQTLKQMEQSKHEVNEKLKTTLEEITEKDNYIKETMQSLQTAETTIREQNTMLEEAMLNKEKVIGLEKETAKLNKEKDDLTTSKEICETRRAALMDASGARNNIKLTKMEDYSHENLAIEFREIYDEEYSNADDELAALQNATKVKNTEYYLLNIVKMAYQLCSTYATEHKQSINESVTSIGVKAYYKNEKQNNSQETVRRVSIGHLMSTLELDEIANLTLWTAIRLQKPIIEVLSEIMVNRFEIEPEKQPQMMKYIRKCLEVCWMMNMHSDPIFVKFEDVTDSAIFDTKTYKVYNNGGKFLDFIVWPPVYAYEGGILIKKGFAEGKEN